MENRRQGENHLFQNICFVTGSSINSGISCLLNGRLSLFRLQTGIILLQLTVSFFPFQDQICSLCTEISQLSWGFKLYPSALCSRAML